ncbi:MAG TPA: nicotinate-nucleotide adenylyltransferase [Acidimicrobiales bacterium]|nr:nicotinate-nucleotide adenylyltransferase [Acidimicrobiales bacterium]
MEGTSGERLGVFGGTFDPIHIAHLVAAVNARHVLRLDRVLLVVANRPWQKSDRTITSAEDRYAMVEAAVTGHAGLEASRVEIDRGGDSYSADTLRALADEDPARELFLVVGADVAAELETWRHVEVVRALATLAVVDRPGAPDVDAGPGWRVVRVDIPHLAISASDLRHRAAAGLPLDYLVPAPVIDLIGARGLYAGGR